MWASRMKTVMSSKRITASRRPWIKPCACEAAASLPVGPTTGASAIWLPGVTAAGQPAGTRNRQRCVRCPGSHWFPARKCRCAFHCSRTIHLGSNVYSVPSRLIGTRLLVRLHAQTIEGYIGTKLAFTLSRLVGTHQHRIDYHHFIWSLVRKPGAFAAYRYRDDLFPTTTFRLAYDRLVEGGAERADRDYVRLLH